MKKKLMLGLALALSLSLAACGGDTVGQQSSQPSTASPESAVPASEPVQNETPFDKFTSGLDSLGYQYETTTMAAELVGGKVGQKYTFDFGEIEIYQFDEGSDALTQALSDGGLYLEGFGVFPCIFNGNLAAIVDLSENEDQIVELFNGL